MSIPTLDRWLGQGDYDTAVSLVESVNDGERRTKGFKKVLDHAIKAGDSLATQTLLDKLGRESLTDEERILFCESNLNFKRLPERISALQEISGEIEDDDARTQVQRKIGLASLDAGVLSGAESLSEEDLLDWVERHAGFIVNEQVAKVIAHFDAVDFTPSLVSAREKYLEQGYRESAHRVANLMGEDSLRWSELMALAAFHKAKFASRHFGSRRDSLRAVLNVSSDLPERNRIPLVRYVILGHIRMGEVHYAIDLLKTLPDKDIPVFAGKILRRQLQRVRKGFSISFRDVWTTEQFLGRKLTLGEVRRRLEFIFTDRSKWLEFIRMLPEKERKPHLEKLLASRISMADLEEAVDLASEIGRELTSGELFRILGAARNFLYLDRIQVNYNASKVERSRARVNRIEALIKERATSGELVI